MSVVTLNDFKNYIGVDATDTSKDAYYQSLVNAAEDRITQFFGGSLASATYTDETHIATSTIVYLQHRPATSVTSLTVNGNAGTTYTLTPDFVRIPGLKQDDTVLITYVAGFVTVPNPIYVAIILAALRILKLQTDQKANPTQAAILTDEIRDLLLPYRFQAL